MVARNIKEIRIIDLCNQVSETATTENNILSERRYSDRSSKCRVTEATDINMESRKCIRRKTNFVKF